MANLDLGRYSSSPGFLERPAKAVPLRRVGLEDIFPVGLELAGGGVIVINPFDDMKNDQAGASVPGQIDGMILNTGGIFQPPHAN